MANAKNLASGKLNSNISASTTSISVYVGNGSSSTVAGVWPTAPFYATIMPSNPTAGVPNSLDSEIIKVTAVTGEASGNVTMTIVRGQKGVTAKAFTSGSIVSHAIYAEEAVLQDDDGEDEVDTAFITARDIVDGSITSDKLDWTTIPKIQYWSGSLTSDSNGFFSIPSSVLTPNNGIIIGATSASGNGFYFPYSDFTQGIYTLRQLNWDLGNVGSSTRTIKIYYIKF